jgi:hypothetical protein
MAKLDFRSVRDCLSAHNNFRDHGDAVLSQATTIAIG